MAVNDLKQPLTCIYCIFSVRLNLGALRNGPSSDDALSKVFEKCSWAALPTWPLAEDGGNVLQWSEAGLVLLGATIARQIDRPEDTRLGHFVAHRQQEHDLMINPASTVLPF